MEKAEDTIEQAIKFAENNHLKIIEITDRPLKNGRIAKKVKVEHKYIYDVGVEEWLGYIKYANYVFTNSFHGCCYSIINELNELKDILVELNWRYGRERVQFSFTQRKKIPDVVPVENIIIISTCWAKRVWIDENPKMTKVYINF